MEDRMGVSNEAGDRLMQFENTKNLLATNTRFKQAKRSRVWT